MLDHYFPKNKCDLSATITSVLFRVVFLFLPSLYCVLRVIPYCFLSSSFKFLWAFLVEEGDVFWN